jgi:hypothetical protein
MLTGYRRRSGMRDLTDLGDLGAVESMVWPTTGDINTETASLANSVSLLGSDYAASSLTTVDDSVALWQRSWNSFVTDFLQWQASPYFWNPSRRNQLVDYRKRFNDLLAAYHNLGGNTLIAPLPGDALQPDSLDKIMTAVKWGGVLLIAGGVVKLASDAGIFKRRT